MARLIRMSLLFAGLISLGIFTVACATSDNNDKQPTAVQPTSGSQGGGAATVKATESEFKIDLGKMSAPAGKVTFELQNTGSMPHEFVVLKTDLPEGNLPVDTAESKVNENANGIESVGEQEEYPAGESKSLSLDLKPGKYVFICNIAGHYTLGMHVAFTVTGS